jgi:hypothetical protein
VIAGIREGFVRIGRADEGVAGSDEDLGDRLVSGGVGFEEQDGAGGRWRSVSRARARLPAGSFPLRAGKPSTGQPHWKEYRANAPL